MGVRGGEDEDDVRGRFLKGLQEGVEGLGRQHMHLVYDIHPVSGDGHVAELLLYLPDVLYSAVGGGVYLNDVYALPLVYLPAEATHPAGLGRRSGLAVQPLGEYAGEGGLPYAPGSGEEEGVGYLLAVKGAGEDLLYELLAYDLFKRPWPVLIRKAHLLSGAWPPQRGGWVCPPQRDRPVCSCSTAARSSWGSRPGPPCTWDRL